MTIYPTVRPSLTLDFQKSKQLDPRISFSRSSSATYVEGGVIKYADEHQARFEEDGLLLEEARTNSVTTSGDVKTAAAQTQTGTSSYVTGIAPDGSSSTTLTSWVPDSGSTDNSLYGIASPGTPAAASVFIKANGWDYAGLWFNNIDGSADGRLFVDLITGEVLANINMSSITVVKCANGWWRVGGSSSTNALGTLSIRCVGSDGNRATPPMNGTDGILLWGLQTESGTFVTSLIPTSGSTVTRAADLASITGDNFSSWYNQIQGSFFVGANHKGSSYFNNAIFLEVNNGTTDNQIKIFSVGADPYLYITDTAAVQAYIDAGSVSVGLPNKYAAGFTTNNFALSVNGATAVTDASGTNPNGITQLVIGANLSGVAQPNGHISRLAYYSRRLTDSELETLTL
jgi:hypothetical protein